MPQGTHQRLGLGRRELISLIAAALVVVAVALPLALSGPGNKTVCRGRLGAIGQALGTYAAENNGCFPVMAHASAAEPGKGLVSYAPGKIGRYRDAAPPADARELSTTANLYLLIRQKRARPEEFICPSSDDRTSAVPSPEAKWDFSSYKEVSYGYQVPYGPAGKPRQQGDPRVAIVADKGPYGLALETGQTHPGAPSADYKGPNKSWRPWNNVNHKKSQNVIYLDAHAEERKTPLAGANKDNIYTRWSDLAKVAAHDPTAWSQGAPPTGTETPLGETDSLIYP
ncbi:MAG: hypothetical protein HRF43_18360 [Phycisphaerae bacterium]|jgi:hypothetical protein